VTILRTPELQDILNKEGLKQIVDVASRVHPNHVGDIIAATTSETLRRDVQPTVEQIEREMKARMARGWLQSGY
jgi:hypothetical protein